MILVPVKNLSNAKQRLSATLDQSDRTELAHAMLRDVAESITAASADEVVLVTSDPFALELAREHGFGAIRDDLNLSETAAIEMATRYCLEKAAECTLVLPGDVPLISSGEIRALYESAPQCGTVLTPSRDKRGTNAVLRRPAALFPLRFGNDSFLPHLTAAIATDKSCIVLSLPGIALDIDTPEDLHELVQAPGEKHSQLLAREFGFGGPEPRSTREPIVLTTKP
jgi:2-phospho-L-lactate guanylyltransferase